MRLGRATAYGMLAMMDIAQRASAARDVPIGNTRIAGNGRHKTHRADSTRGNGIAKHANGRNGATEPACARADQISQATGIPVEYLRKVLQRLTRARLVVSERGRGGGFRLAKPAARVNLLDIVEAIEGPIDEVAFLGDGLLRGRVAREHPHLKRWRKEASSSLRELFAGTTLKDLMR